MICVTGATGHIGNNFVRLLIQRNIPVRILLRKSSEATSDLVCEMAYGDIFDYEFLSRHVHKGDILVHLAGFIDMTNQLLEESMIVNDYGTRRIMDYCFENQIRLVYTSSVDAINRTSDTKHIKEPTAFYPELLGSNYALTKAKSTQYLYHLIEEKQMDACILYPSAVIGINDFKPSAAGKEILSTINKRFFFYIDGGYNFIDVEDVSNLIYLAIEKKTIGGVILGGYNVTIHQLYREINRILNKKALYIPIPKWFAIIYSKFSRRFSEVMLQAVFDNYDYDLTRMNELYHYSLKPIEKTIEDTVAWIKSHFEKKSK